MCLVCISMGSGGDALKERLISWVLFHPVKCDPQYLSRPLLIQIRLISCDSVVQKLDLEDGAMPKSCQLWHQLYPYVRF